MPQKKTFCFPLHLELRLCQPVCICAVPSCNIYSFESTLLSLNILPYCPHLLWWSWGPDSSVWQCLYNTAGFSAVSPGSEVREGAARALPSGLWSVLNSCRRSEYYVFERLCYSGLNTTLIKDVHTTQVSEKLLFCICLGADWLVSYLSEWVTVGKPLSVRGKVTHTTSAGKPVPEVNSLILHVIHLDFMLVKHQAVLPPYRNDNTELPPYFHIPCVSTHKNSQGILSHPSASWWDFYIHQGGARGSLRNRHHSAPHAAGAWDATAEKWSAAETWVGAFRLWVPVTTTHETIKLIPKHHPPHREVCLCIPV